MGGNLFRLLEWRFPARMSFVLAVQGRLRIDQPVTGLDLLAFGVELLERHGMLAAFLAHLIVAGIDHHARQPAPQRVAAEGMEPAECRDQRFLHGICRHIFIVQQSQCDPKEQILIAQDQKIEGSRSPRWAALINVFSGVEVFCKPFIHILYLPTVTSLFQRCHSFVTCLTLYRRHPKILDS